MNDIALPPLGARAHLAWRALWGASPATRLPAAVAKSIREQEWSSEILMRIVQLVIVVAFGILYFVSPKPHTAASSSLVPTALAIYLALTVFGLAWSLRRELPDWAAYGSVAVDVGLLMVLIWSFHRQYGQPPSFYLKAPTFLYVFIFITLRALRFRPSFVVLAGSATILAWAAMVAYVLVAEGREPLTRDYVRYLTSNALLIGGEIDKLIAIGVVTGILYVLLRRTRALLVQAVSEGAAAANLSRFFDETVASRIRIADDPSAQATRREAALLFVDLRGFTQLAARLEPTEVIRFLAEYQRRLVPLVRAHGGVIDKFLGDGIMASFGTAQASSTYAADALRTVDAIMAEVRRWSADGPLSRLPPRSVGAAVAAGSVIFGTVGDPTRLEFTVIGAPVNLAAKLEKTNKRLGSQAITTADAYALAVAQGYSVQPTAAFVRREVEGVPGPQELVILHA